MIDNKRCILIADDEPKMVRVLRDGNLKQHMKNRYLCFKMLQLFIRILDYPVAK